MSTSGELVAVRLLCAIASADGGRPVGDVILLPPSVAADWVSSQIAELVESATQPEAAMRVPARGRG